MQGAVLDRHSRCCLSGHLDACGECDGGAKAVDVENGCCSSGALDGAGFCCASGRLDECGVCDGDSSSCALHAVADVQVRPRALPREPCPIHDDVGPGNLVSAPYSNV